MTKKTEQSELNFILHEKKALKLQFFLFWEIRVPSSDWTKNRHLTLLLFSWLLKNQCTLPVSCIVMIEDF